MSSENSSHWIDKGWDGNWAYHIDGRAQAMAEQWGGKCE